MNPGDKSTGSERFSRRYWSRILRFVGICILAIALVSLLTVTTMGVGWVERIIRPPRRPVETTPSQVGIERYEEVAFTTVDGLTLRGWYVPSANGAAVILCHGHAANRTALLPSARILVEHGYGVLLFDWRYHGQSDGEGAVTFGVEEEKDLEAAIDFVAARPDVDPERIGALGISMGGAIVIQVAADHPQLKAVVAEQAFPSLEAEARHMLRAFPLIGPLLAWWGEMRIGYDPAEVRPVDDICGISPRPILLIYGTEDQVVPPESAQQMAAAACEPKTLWLIEGGGHTLFAKDFAAEYDQRVPFFFEALLR